MLGTAATLALQTHPAAAGALYAAINNALACATTAACVSGTNSASGPGVAGTSARGRGVSGISGNNFGVYGTVTSGNGIGVVGQVPGSATGTFGGSDAGFGVYGLSRSGSGIFGFSSTGAGISGASSTSYGVVGNSSGNVAGVYGSAPYYGVWGTATTTLAGTGAGVIGDAPNGAGYGVYGEGDANAGGTGVLGDGTSVGVAARSTSGFGVQATSYYGTAVFATGQSGNAIQASSSTADGVVAHSDSAVGAFGGSNSGTGVWGASNSYYVYEPAVYGEGNSYGGHFYGRYGGVWGEAPATGGYPIVATDSNWKTVFDVDSSGNISYAGTLKSLAVTADGATVRAYSAKTTLPTVEDTGTAQLVGGSATVKLDSIFARTIDSTTSYRVFVTPNGDTHGLFVASKTAGGFVVHENEGGRSTVSFDYRIVATAIGHAGERMAVAKRSEVMPQFSQPRRPATPKVKAPTALPARPALPVRP